MNFTLDEKKVSNFLEANKRNDKLSFIGQSGVYPIKINYVGITTTSKGSKSFYINYSLEGDNNSSLLYGGVFEKGDGSICDYGFNQIQAMQLVFGLKTLTTTQKKIKIFNGEEREIDLFKELQDKKCFIQVTLEYSKYNNKISRRILFRDIFRVDDKASALEIANKKGYGNKFKWNEEHKEKISQPSYRDVTEDEVKTWVESRKSQTTQTKSTNEKVDFEEDNGELPF